MVQGIIGDFNIQNSEELFNTLDSLGYHYEVGAIGGEIVKLGNGKHIAVLLEN